MLPNNPNLLPNFLTLTLAGWMIVIADCTGMFELAVSSEALPSRLLGCPTLSQGSIGIERFVSPIIPWFVTKGTFLLTLHVMV